MFKYYVAFVGVIFSGLCGIVVSSFASPIDTHISGDLPPVSRGYSIPVIDLNGVEDVITVDRQKGQYLGHPTAVLLEDDKTILCVYPKGHGKGGIVYKKSTDGGATWSERLATPENWKSSLEVPTIHRVMDKNGTERLIMWSGLYPARLAVSEDAGDTWSDLNPVGDWGGIVVMGALARLSDGTHAAWFHDDGRFLSASKGSSRFDVFQTHSGDGGLTWSNPVAIAHMPAVHLCEPGVVRSPDGKTLALLLRENSRRKNSYVIFSENEGKTWSEPRELPGSLTGDRHTAVYTDDGRLFISFRDTTHESSTKGDWVAWVGSWDDIVKGREGQYRIRLLDNHVRGDCAYPAVLKQKDGTIVTITYGHWTPGESPWIACRRMTMDDLDQRFEKLR